MTFLAVAIVLVAIPFAVKLVETRQQLKSKASGDEIKFVESNTLKCKGNDCTTTKPDIEVELHSPFGGPQPTPAAGGGQ